jgi:hypothetical protein
MKKTPLKRSGFRKKTPDEIKQAILNRTGSSLKRTPIRKVGKIGKANLKANKIIREQEKPQYCELSFPDCTRGLFLTIAHRHKRVWYKGDPELLADKNQWIVACVNCHDKIEHNQELTEKVFNNLRP